MTIIKLTGEMTENAAEVFLQALRKRWEARYLEVLPPGAKMPKFLGGKIESHGAVLQYEDPRLDETDWGGYPLGPPPGITASPVDPFSFIFNWPPYSVVIGITDQGHHYSPASMKENEDLERYEALFKSESKVTLVKALLIEDNEPSLVREFEAPVVIMPGVEMTIYWSFHEVVSPPGVSW